MSAIRVPGCPGTSIRELLSMHPGLQILEVTVESGGRIPLHLHDCAATMIVTRGSARKLTADGSTQPVKPGDVLAKAAKEPHGFDDVGEGGFTFISLSDGRGIVDPSLHEVTNFQLMPS
ncbi:MAG TPA: cupin domain-containing protein [Candidatus Paceibacterota bacterium]|jgi:quercetin dioxygenase-like cupin family protein|nr:cupin domain-containing protein [Candidatus Paceibacterota bacterium]